MLSAEHGSDGDELRTEQGESIERMTGKLKIPIEAGSWLVLEAFQWIAAANRIHKRLTHTTDWNYSETKLCSGQVRDLHVPSDCPRIVKRRIHAREASFLSMA